MSDGVLIVQTNRASSALNVGIALVLAALLSTVTVRYIAASTFFPETPNQWVRAVVDNLILIVLTLVPLVVLGRVILYHALIVSHGYVAMLDDRGVRIVRHGRMRIVPWSEMLEFSIVDRLMSIGVDHSIRPGQRRIVYERVSLKYSQITANEILRRVRYERPDLLDSTIRRDV